MSAIVTPAARTARPEKSFEPAIFAVMIAGACTFLNVYCTQPLLPLFQRLFHASEIEVSMTVGAITLAVALMAPVTGMIAETIGRKKVIVPALFALAVPTLLAATSQSLHALIFWRFAQGLFVPGVIAVMMAYINEEFAGRVGTVMSAYVAGTVFGGFLGRFLVGIIAAHWNWRAAFVTLGILDLLGALAVRQWLPLAVHFVPAKHVFKSARDTWGHLRNPRLLAICGLGFTVLFSLVGVFTYVNFYLAQPPFNLTPAELGSIFFVYLLGCVVTPLAGRFLDRHGFRRTMLLSLGMCLGGLLLTLAPFADAGHCRAGDFFLRHFRLAIGGHGADGTGGRTRPLRRRRALRDFLLCRRERGRGVDGVVLVEGRLARLRRFVCRHQPDYLDPGAGRWKIRGGR